MLVGPQQCPHIYRKDQRATPLERMLPWEQTCTVPKIPASFRKERGYVGLQEIDFLNFHVLLK